MGAQFVIDTNAVIDFLNGRLPTASAAWLQRATDERRLLMPVVVRIELLSWLGTAGEMQLLQDFIATTEALELDESVIQQTIWLRQQHKIKLPDALIAASAQVAGAALLTRNTGDFSRLPGLLLLNPHDAAVLPML